MNLTTGSWIPVVWEDGSASTVSLLDVFQQGERICDLAVRPHERIALMRLFVCVAQAALDGPQSQDDWRCCRLSVPQAVRDYLSKWQHAFELFGDGQRFLQVPNIEPTKGGGDDVEAGGAPSKLDVALATGNNSTLFDNAGGSDRRFSPGFLALSLLTFQNFSPASRITDVRWAGQARVGSSIGSSPNAPCVAKAMLHAYVKKGSLLDSVWANLLPKEQLRTLGYAWGAPVWERMPDGPSDSAAVQNATGSYLGRLVPLSRVVWFVGEGAGMILGRGLDFDPSWREPAATWVIRERNGKPERTYLGASLAKSVWREAHSISVLTTAAVDLLGGPLAFVNAASYGGMDVWCGALVADQSKLLDAVESVLHIPAPMFSDEGQRLYGEGVRQAERWSDAIDRAIATCHRELHDDLEQRRSRARGNIVKQKAGAHYWTAIEQEVPHLLALVENPAALRPEDAERDQWGQTEWGRALARAARAAYELACPHETPRQMRAYALGLGVLFRPVEAKGSEDEATVEETQE